MNGFVLIFPLEPQGSRGSVLPTGPTAILHEAREVNEGRKINASFKNTYQKQEVNPSLH